MLTLLCMCSRLSQSLSSANSFGKIHPINLICNLCAKRKNCSLCPPHPTVDDLPLLRYPPLPSPVLTFSLTGFYGADHALTVANVCGPSIPRGLGHYRQLLLQYLRNAACDVWEMRARLDCFNRLLLWTSTHPYAAQFSVGVSVLCLLFQSLLFFSLYYLSDNNKTNNKQNRRVYCKPTYSVISHASASPHRKRRDIVNSKHCAAIWRMQLCWLCRI